MYKVKFQNPITNLVVSKWMSLKDIADLQQIRSDKRHLLCKMFLVALSNEQKLVRQGFDITFILSPDGNYHFSDTTHYL